MCGLHYEFMGAISCLVIFPSNTSPRIPIFIYIYGQTRISYYDCDCVNQAQSAPSSLLPPLPLRSPRLALASLAIATTSRFSFSRSFAQAVIWPVSKSLSVCMARERAAVNTKMATLGDSARNNHNFVFTSAPWAGC